MATAGVNVVWPLAAAGAKGTVRLRTDLETALSVLEENHVVKRDFDLIVYGATGYTGRLIAEYLATSYRGDDAPSWAIGDVD